MEYSSRLNPNIPTTVFLVYRLALPSKQLTRPKPQSSQQTQMPIIVPNNRECSVSVRERMINTPN